MEECSVKLWLTDPSLAAKVVFGAFTSHQFRLEGFGKWEGAREAVFDAALNCLTPSNKRPPPVCLLWFISIQCEFATN